MGQLVFEWPASTSYAAADFIPSPANQEAAQFLEHWPQAGGSPIALLCGGKGYGKTHLAYSWRERTNAILLDALGNVPSEHWWKEHKAALLEDIDKITDETSLFHVLRHAESHGHILLLTSSLPAAELPFILPDLCSRLRALPSVTLLPPDETLLHFFCVKFCADHQICMSDEVIAYLIKRTERSFSGLQNVLSTIIRISMSQKREITIPWLRSVLTFM